MLCHSRNSWGYFLVSGIYWYESGIFFETVMCYLQICVTMPCTYRMMSYEPLERPTLTGLMDHPQEGKRVAMPFILCFYWNELKKKKKKKRNQKYELCCLFMPRISPYIMLENRRFQTGKKGKEKLWEWSVIKVGGAWSFHSFLESN